MTQGFVAGTDQLMPPECIVGNERKGYEGDMWAAGGLFVEIFMLEDLWSFPAENVVDRQFMREVMAKKTVPHALAKLKVQDGEIYDKVACLLNYDKTKRSTAKDNLVMW